MTPPLQWHQLDTALFPEFVVRSGKWFRSTVFAALLQLSRAAPSPSRNATALWKNPLCSAFVAAYVRRVATREAS
jgi:hypothetical protein